MSTHNSTASANETSPYSYLPTEYVGIIFVALFGASTAIHFVQAIVFRLWWLIPTMVLGGVGEVAGWSGRLWSSLNILDQTPFMMQVVLTIISPTPLLAAIFIVFGRMTKLLGIQYSRLSPGTYSKIFLTCDIVALIIQGAGGGIAAGADNNTEQANRGGNIMLAGIVFQLAAQLVFITLATEYYIRFLRNRPLASRPINTSRSIAKMSSRGMWTTRVQLMSIGLTISTLFILIRSVYRTIELSDGWTGKVVRTQVYFNVFDGAMIVIAIFTLNFFHPGFLLPELNTEEVHELRSKSERASTETTA